jgi:hypothetical protein
MDQKKKRRRKRRYAFFLISIIYTLQKAEELHELFLSEMESVFQGIGFESRAR